MVATAGATLLIPGHVVNSIEDRALVDLRVPDLQMGCFNLI